MSLYPGSVDDNTTLPNPSNVLLNTPPVVHSVLHGNENDAIKAIESKLGTGASTASLNSFLVGTGSGATSHVSASSARTAMGLGSLATLSSISLTTNVTGILPVANGGSGVGTITGLVKGNGTSAFTAAAAGTDYAPATSGTSLLKGNGSGGFNNATAGSDYAGISTAQVLTATEVDPRVLTSSASSVTPTASLYDFIDLTPSANLTINSPGTGANGKGYMYRIKDAGSALSITWNAIFRAMGVGLPGATIPGKYYYIGVVYNATDVKYDVVAVTLEP